MEMKKYAVSFNLTAGSKEDRIQNNLRVVFALEKTLEEKNLSDQLNIVKGPAADIMTIVASDAALAEVRKTKGIQSIGAM